MFIKMKQINEKEYKLYLKNCFYYFSEYCKSHNLQYYLMYGSLIGAAREGGIIPWDDDIDIIMPRKCYVELVNTFNNSNSRYKLISMHNNSDFNAPLAKIIDTNTLLIQNYGQKENCDLGIYLDIFILDGVPNNETTRNKYINRSIKLTRKWMQSCTTFDNNKSIIWNVCRYIRHLDSHLLGYKHYLRSIDKFASKYSFDESEYIGNLSFVQTCNEVFLKSYFEPSYLEFEGIKAMVPKEYDKVLTQMYGEWKKPPKAVYRKSHHKFECYLKEGNLNEK